MSGSGRRSVHSRLRPSPKVLNEDFAELLYRHAFHDISEPASVWCTHGVVVS